jgi:hypothetical protein
MEEGKERFIKTDKGRKTLCPCAAKWPKLEGYVKNWKIDHRKNGIAVPTKLLCLK